jgi:hypothetical protein
MEYYRLMERMGWKMVDRTEIEDDIADCNKRLEKLHDNYIKATMNGGVTRAKTTTYNARCGQLCERRDELKSMLNKTENS